MPQCVIIADDLTGANATGVLLKKMNYSAFTALSLGEDGFAGLPDCDCLVFPTDSRGIDARLAYERVRAACKALQGNDVKLYSKRVDSTLRGNVGCEIDAMLDFLGEEYAGLVVPCFPTSGRIVIGGYMLVNGVPLHKTEVAIDPKAPVKTSEVAVIIGAQTKRKIASIFMNDLAQGKDHLARLIRERVAEGFRVLCFDCVQQEDLDLIADAAIASGVKALAVSPGPFTAALAARLLGARKVDKEGRGSKAKVLAVVGSVYPNARVQMEEFWHSSGAFNVFVRTREFLEGDERREREIERVVSLVLKEGAALSSVTGDGIYTENRIDFGPYMQRCACTLDEATGVINRAFAEVAFRIFKADAAFRGLYTMGGDITIAVCSRFSALGFNLIDEVLPHAAYGRLAKGEFDGIHFVSKGGSQGGPDAILRCVSYLEERLNIQH